MDAPILPVTILGIGAYLAWFGVHYWDSDIKWPTDPIKDVLTGKGIPAPSGQTPASSIASNIEAQTTQTAVTGPGAASTAPSVSGTYSIQDLMNLW